jgi:hypothetical protein
MDALNIFDQFYLFELSPDELELLHNLLYSGCRWGDGKFPLLAAKLLQQFDEFRGEIPEDRELFEAEDTDNKGGLMWKRTD